LKERVMVGMSGGVDSSVAASLLLDNDYDVTGITMKLWENPFKEDICNRTCCSIEDVRDAKSVAYSLGIPFYVLNMKKVFSREVVDYFVSEYIKGKTPNPCMVCNKVVKFQEMLRKALMLEHNYIATGHYVLREYDEKTERFLLKKAIDKTKDQSYFLYMMNQKQLKHTLFPNGVYTKEQIRKIAETKRLVNSKKPDSQDICFISNKHYSDFIIEWLGKPFPSGEFVDINGNVLGKHKGHIYYTTGQRKGIGISAERPLYVIDKDNLSNKVTVGFKEQVRVKGLIAEQLNFIPFDYPKKDFKAHVKIRYSSNEIPANIKVLDKNKVYVEFANSEEIVPTGQSVVFYEDEYVIGGGIISGKKM